jgi:phosphoglycolate phosphatase
MLKDYSAVIWDWNGTLLNDLWLVVDLGNEQLVAHGLAPLGVDEYRKIFCHPIQELYAALGFDFNRKPFAQLSHEFHVVYQQRRPECMLHPEAPSVLQRLRELGKRQFVLSAQQEDILKASLTHFGVSSFFEHASGLATTLAHSKVELGRELMRKIGVVPKDTVLVGDTLHDFEVATVLGIGCVLVAQGYQDRALLEATGVPVVSDLSELGSL